MLFNKVVSADNGFEREETALVVARLFFPEMADKIDMQMLLGPRADEVQWAKLSLSVADYVLQRLSEERDNGYSLGWYERDCAALASSDIARATDPRPGEGEG